MRMFVILGILAFAVGCRQPASEPPEGPSDDGVVTSNATCEGLAIAEDHAVPMRAVEISLPPELSNPWLRITREGSAHVSVATIFEREDGTHVFSAPLHPLSPDGGAVSLQLTDGESYCPGVEFHIDALPDSPGTTDAVLAPFEEAITGGLEARGIDPARAAEYVSVSEEAIEITASEEAGVMVLLWHLMQSADNSVSFRNLMADASAEEREYLDRLLGTFLETYPPEDFQPAGLVSIIEDPGACLIDPDEIEDEETLSRVMNHCGRPRCNQLRAADLGALSDVANFLSTPDPGSPAGAASLSFATVMTALLIYSAWMCATRPERIVAVDVVPDPLEIEEDYEGPKPFEEVEVTAKGGPPFVVTERLAQAVTQIVSVFGAYKQLQNGNKPLTNIEGLENFMMEWFNQVYVQLMKIAGLGIGTTVGPVELKVSLTTMEYLLVVPQSGRVVPRDTLAGVGLKAVSVGGESCEVVPRPEKFASNLLSALVPTPVEAIDPDLGPRVRAATPGATVSVEYRVDHAIDPSLEWASIAGLSTLSTTQEAGAVTVTLPTDEMVYPFDVYATSTSSGGLRASPNAPIRRGTTTFVLDDLVAGPSGICIPPGGSEPLFASASSPTRETPELTWTSPFVEPKEGSIVTFTAPISPGTYEVTVTATFTDSTRSETLELIVGDCACWATFTATGALGATQRFDFDQTLTRRQVPDDPDTTFFLLHFTDPDGPVGLLEWYSPSREIVSGEYPATLRTTRAPAEQYTSYPATLTIEVEPTGHFEGNLTATMYAGDVDQPIGLAVGQLRFRGVVDFDQPGQSSYCSSDLTYTLFEPHQAETDP